MKKIGVGIVISKVWNKLEYWTNNRALLKENPNKSRETLNETYGMSEDDKEYFFNDYLKTSANEIYSSKIFSAIRRWNKQSFNVDFVCDYKDDVILFYFVVGKYFPVKTIQELLSRYVEQKVLWYWYYMKNLMDECAIIDIEIAKVEQEIKNIVSKDWELDKDDSVRTICYNNGFVINPELEDEDIPSNEDEVEYYPGNLYWF